MATGLGRIGGAVAESHHPAKWPGGLLAWALEDGGIGAAGFIGAAHGEADQEIACDRIDLGVFRACGGSGTDGIGRQVGIDQDRAHLLLALAWVEISQPRKALAIALQLCV